MPRTGVFAAALLLAVSSGCTESTPSPLEPVDTDFAYAVTGFLQCPIATTRVAQGTIGRAGGTLSLDGHRLTLPPGAVLRRTAFTLTVPASDRVEIQVHADRHESFWFLLPALITISYDRCPDGTAIDESRLSVWHIDELTGQLLESMDGTLDPDHRALTFPTGHLSGFVIAN